MHLHTVADIKLAGRAINEEWPVTRDLRSQLITDLGMIASDGAPEMRIAAAKVILAADALNAKKREAEQKQLNAEHARKLQLIELAVKLGIARPDSDGTGIADSRAPDRKH